MTVASELKEAVPIGRLLGVENRTIGWVYFWNTSDIAVLWLSDAQDPISFIPITRENFTSATEVEINRLLGDILVCKNNI